jgi:ketosteroid isomerase-like protein
MKYILLFSIIIFGFNNIVGQNFKPKGKNEKAVYELIDKYSLAREKQDTVLLKSILTDDIDQLVSNGEWRYGMAAASKGMMQSSATNGGKRMLTIEKVKFLSKNSAIADCRYEIENKDGTARKMWSTFIVINEKGIWKISAIRNMLPQKS